MAESQSGYDAAEYTNELDTGIAGVMPSTWRGHGRILIHESDLTDSQKNFAGRALDKLTTKYPQKSSEVLAQKAIDYAKENRE